MGYGWGYLYGMGLSETLINLFYQRTRQRRRYRRVARPKQNRTIYRVTNAETPYDEKVMQQLILHGLLISTSRRRCPGMISSRVSTMTSILGRWLAIRRWSSHPRPHLHAGHYRQQSVLSLSSEEGEATSWRWLITAWLPPLTQPIQLASLPQRLCAQRGRCYAAPPSIRSNCMSTRIIATADNEFVDVES
ncbi:MAG: hypothetical protein R3A10_16065 [Caldilineaceae bacterium]